MRFREWFRDALQPRPDDTPSPDFAQLQQTSRRLLAAGDAAINKTLSGNSQAFLAACRQQGGQ